MALDAFLSFGGKIKGSVTQKGREGKIRVYAVDHKIEAMADGASGFPGKTVMPGALVATKSVDLASAPLQQALQENTVFGSVNLEMCRMPPTGGMEENHYTIVMTDVQVKSIRTYMRFNKPADDSLIPEIEEVALSYKAISFTYKSADGSASAGPFLRDKFDDRDDSLKLAIQKGVSGAAKALGTQIGIGLKDALKKEEEKVEDPG
jgi:type VI secretion system secreted protein Hcp